MYKPWEIDVGVGINSGRTNIARRIILKTSQRKPGWREEKRQEIKGEGGQWKLAADI